MKKKNGVIMFALVLLYAFICFPSCTAAASSSSTAQVEGIQQTVGSMEEAELYSDFYLYVETKETAKKIPVKANQTKKLAGLPQLGDESKQLCVLLCLVVTILLGVVTWRLCDKKSDEVV